MKRVILKLMAGVAACLWVCTVQAQTADSLETSAPKERPAFKEVPNPEKMAQRETDTLKVLLQLTEEQYEKVYELNLKEAEKRAKAMAMMRNGGPRRPMGGGQFPPMGGGGMPPMPGGEGFGGGEAPQKTSGRLDKKMKKILTDEQYEKYTEWRKEQQAKRPARRPRPQNADAAGEAPEEALQSAE